MSSKLPLLIEIETAVILLLISIPVMAQVPRDCEKAKEMKAKAIYVEALKLNSPNWLKISHFVLQR